MFALKVQFRAHGSLALRVVGVRSENHSVSAKARAGGRRRAWHGAEERRALGRARERASPSD
ncbi:MAG: hypothetical protein KGL50_02910, partial [Burkholderiales bacterium]|nr:hypothetical protein [Burkholderiales bacterium]